MQSCNVHFSGRPGNMLTCALAWNSPAAKAEKNMIKNFFISCSFKEQLMLVNCRLKIICGYGKGIFKSCKTGIFCDKLLFRDRDRYFRVKYQLSRLLLQKQGIL